MESPTIGIGVLSYNCRDELKRCLDSLKDFKVIVVDGKWNDFIDNNDSYRSTDGTIELAKSYSNVTTIESPNQPEWINRNKYIVEGKDCDVMFWVDSDEWVELPCGYDFLCRSIKYVFEKQNDCYSFLVHYFDTARGGACYQKRGIRYPDIMRHVDRHNQLWFNDKEVLTNYCARPPMGLVIHTDKKFRTDEREEAMKRRNYENTIR